MNPLATIIREHGWDDLQRWFVFTNFEEYKASVKYWAQAGVRFVGSDGYKWYLHACKYDDYSLE